MDPLVVAAWIAAAASAATLAGTLIEQTRSRRQQREQLDRTLKAQSEQLATQLTAQSKQLEDTLAEQRTRTLNERFAAAAAQLGSDKPAAVQLAGVYAMAGLADDWEERRQTCVDVLCGYLRMPYEPDPGPEAAPEAQQAFRALREVRHTVVRVITAHLQPDDRRAASVQDWRGLDLDFTGTVFDGSEFGGGSFGGAQFTGSRVNFDGARFTGGYVNFRGARFAGSVSFRGAQFTGGEVNFVGAQFTDGNVFFVEAQFVGCEVSFHRAHFAGCQVNFFFAQFTGGRVSFSHAEFTGGQVSFTGANFAGGEVYFGDPYDWSVPPTFPWLGEPPPGVTLPKLDAAGRRPRRDPSQVWGTAD